MPSPAGFSEVRVHTGTTQVKLTARHLRRFSTRRALDHHGKGKYTFSPAELSSERREKEVLADSKQPTAPPSTKSHVSYCAARVRRREKMAAEGTSSTTG